MTNVIPFRSDADAILARSRSLETENERLRAEVLELEEENQSLHGALQRLAAQDSRNTNQRNDELAKLRKDVCLLEMENDLIKSDENIAAKLREIRHGLALMKYNQADIDTTRHRIRMEARTMLIIAVIFCLYSFLTGIFGGS